MPDPQLSPSSHSGSLNAYDRARIGDNGLLHALAAGLGMLAQVELKDFGNWGPFVAVLAWFLGDYVNRARVLGIGLDAANRGAVNRNLLFSALALASCYVPWLYQGVEVPAPWANMGLYVLDAIKRFLDENQPKDGEGKPLPVVPIRPSLPTIALVAAVLCLPSLAWAGPRTIKVGANIQGQWTWVSLICPSRDILDYVVEFGEDAGPQPTPVPVPPGPAPGPPPQPVPIPPDPGPVPTPPAPNVEPTFPPGEYDIAQKTYDLAKAVVSANRQRETTALADGLLALKADCDAGRFKGTILPPQTVSVQIAFALKDKLKTSLGASYDVWNASLGKQFQEAIFRHFDAGKLDSAAQWSVMLGEIVPALREAAKR